MGAMFCSGCHSNYFLGRFPYCKQAQPQRHLATSVRKHAELRCNQNPERFLTTILSHLAVIVANHGCKRRAV